VQIFNEIALMSCIHLMCLFSDYVPDPVQRYSIGWSYLSYLGFIFFVNILAVVIGLIITGKKAKLIKKEAARIRSARFTELES
jgi:hypothetical protein